MASDGNVVIYQGTLDQSNDGTNEVNGAPKHQTWSTMTSRKPSKQRWWHSADTAVSPHHEFRLRRDGVLVVIDTDRSKVLWKSTGKLMLKGDYRAYLSNVGHMVVELNNQTVWSSAGSIGTIKGASR